MKVKQILVTSEVEMHNAPWPYRVKDYIFAVGATQEIAEDRAMARAILHTDPFQWDGNHKQYPYIQK